MDLTTSKHNIKWAVLGFTFFFVVDKIAVVAPIILDQFLEIKSVGEVYLFIGLLYLILTIWIIIMIEKFVINKEFRFLCLTWLILIAVLLVISSYLLHGSDNLIVSDGDLSRDLIIKLLGTIAFMAIAFRVVIFIYLCFSAFGRLKN